MLFSSQVFILLFLPIAVLGFHALRDTTARIRWLLAASLVFYGWWDLAAVPVLAASVLGNWTLAELRVRLRLPLAVVAGVALNLALLGVYKYADFFAAMAAALTGQAHEPWGLTLPLGISFFTFQQISYLVDVHRGRVPHYPLERYATLVAFFPHLIAGPIVRHNELIPQFDQDPRRAEMAALFGRGLLLFTLGLLKKVFLADELGAESDPLFAQVAAGGGIGTGQAWYAALCYSGQLYLDFSAYSDMAIGLALLFGYHLPLNFDRPYAARDIREFWRRWHITLSRFLRDYVYIPLGGSRQGALATAGATLLTMFVCGLWHGAGWTFIAWGMAHGVALVASRAWAATPWRLPGPLAWLLTMLFVVCGWVLFRAESFTVAATMLRAMAGAGGGSVPVDGDDLPFLALALLLAIAGPTNVEIARTDRVARRAVAAAAGLAFVIVTMRVGYGRSVEFLYFQF